MSAIAPGWYKDPADPTTQRYWDGEGWIGHALPADVQPPPGPPPAEPPPGASGGAPAGLQGEPVPPGPAPTPYPGAGMPPGPGLPPPAGMPPGPGAPPGSGTLPDPGTFTGPGAPPGSGTPSGPGTEHGPGMPPGPGASPATGHPGGGPPPGWRPYQYPIRVPPIRPHGLTLATPGARLIARLIDIAVLAVLNVLVNGWLVWQYVKEVQPAMDAWMRYLTRESTEAPERSSRSGYLQIAIILVTAALWLAYEVPAVANTGQTLGKRILGIQVVRVEASGPVGFARSLRRWNTLGLPTLLWPCCGIGFVLQFVDVGYVLVDRLAQQALHDKSARTVVVRVGTPEGPHRSGEPDQPDEPDQARTDHRTDSPGGSA